MLFFIIFITILMSSANAMNQQLDPQRDNVRRRTASLKKLEEITKHDIAILLDELEAGIDMLTALSDDEYSSSSEEESDGK